jgi:predicted DNA-binding protein YlxM (UPF0122 family)
MVYTPQKTSREKPNALKHYKELKKYSKDDIARLGSIDSKNIDALAAKFSAIFSHVNQQRKMLLKIEAKIEIFSNSYILAARDTHIHGKLERYLKHEIEITIDRIKTLEEEDEEDEYGEVINPTEYAVQNAIELVSEAAKSIPEKFFKAWVSTEDSGGIRLTWSKPALGKKVKLVIPSTPDRKIYLYHDVCDEYGVEYNVSSKTLSRWLSWCNSK